MLRRISIAAALAALSLHAETGYRAWLRYAPLEEPALSQYRQSLPAVVSTAGTSVLEGSARDELVRGVRGMLGRTMRTAGGPPAESAIVLGTLTELSDLQLRADLPPDGFWL